VVVPDTDYSSYFLLALDIVRIFRYDFERNCIVGVELCLVTEQRYLSPLAEIEESEKRPGAL
jgi:hypothetical protein